MPRLAKLLSQYWMLHLARERNLRKEGAPLPTYEPTTDGETCYGCKQTWTKPRGCDASSRSASRASCGALTRVTIGATSHTRSPIACSRACAASASKWYPNHRPGRRSTDEAADWRRASPGLARILMHALCNGMAGRSRPPLSRSNSGPPRAAYRGRRGRFLPRQGVVPVHRL